MYSTCDTQQVSFSLAYVHVLYTLSNNVSKEMNLNTLNHFKKIDSVKSLLFGTKQTPNYQS